MCTARRFSSSVCKCMCVCVSRTLRVCVSCLRFVPLVYAHYVSAARGKLTNCCTRNDAGGATQVHSARKHTHTNTRAHTRIHTKEYYSWLCRLAHLAFSNLIFRLTAKSFFFWSLYVTYTRFFHCPFHPICTTEGRSVSMPFKMEIGNRVL